MTIHMALIRGMRMDRNELRREAATFAGTAATAMAFGVATIGLVAMGAHFWGVEYSVLTREPQVVLGGPAYVGLLSNLGAVVWALPTAVCFLAATLFQDRRRWMFGAAAVLSLLLLADDLFLLHDAVFPLIGIRERIVQLLYFALIGALLAGFWRRMGAAVTALVIVAVGFWGMSALLDRSFNASPLNLDQLTEDGLKFMGIVLWAGAWLILARRELSHNPRADGVTAGSDDANPVLLESSVRV